jgi:hypothetical protein
MNNSIKNIATALIISWVTWVSYTLVEIDKKASITELKLTSLNGFFQDISEK